MFKKKLIYVICIIAFLFPFSSFAGERGDEKILFDTGQGYALVHNARILGIDLALIRKVVLSHGHNDHTGGLAEFLRVGDGREVYAHPGIFSARLIAAANSSRPPGW